MDDIAVAMTRGWELVKRILYYVSDEDIKMAYILQDDLMTRLGVIALQSLQFIDPVCTVDSSDWKEVINRDLIELAGSLESAELPIPSKNKMEYLPQSLKQMIEKFITFTLALNCAFDVESNIKENPVKYMIYIAESLSATWTQISDLSEEENMNLFLNQLAAIRFSVREKCDSKIEKDIATFFCDYIMISIYSEYYKNCTILEAKNIQIPGHAVYTSPYLRKTYTETELKDSICLLQTKKVVQLVESKNNVLCIQLVPSFIANAKLPTKKRLRNDIA